MAYWDMEYEWTEAYTPSVTATSPTSGSSGDLITITGTHFGMNASDATVTIGDAKCVIQTITDTSITCNLGNHAAGKFPLVVQTDTLGKSNKFEFTYK